jgi:hypothetical protein
MSSEDLNKEKLVSYLLESLRYQDKVKEDTSIINQLRTVFSIPQNAELKTYLIEKIDFSDLFAELLRIAEPFAKMMSQIYLFLSDKKRTARSPQHLIVGESVSNRISFDLESFPQIYQPVIQEIETFYHVYDLQKVLNSNISPLFLTEGLLGCGNCTDADYQKPPKCEKCGDEMVGRFNRVFEQYGQMINLIPEEIKVKSPYSFLCRYAEDAAGNFQTGMHWDRECRGYDFWSERLDEVENRFEQVRNEEYGKYNVETLLRFFELPFWKERNRLYEVWTLVYLLHLLRGVSIELNIKDDQGHLVYGDSSEPIAWIRGYNFEVEIWYQHKLKKGGMFDFLPVEPEMLFIYKGKDGKNEPIILVECKERKDYDVREIAKLSAFYRAQVGTAINFFFNYYEYSPPTGIRISADEPPVILVDNFRPGENALYEVEKRFIELINNKLGIFLQALLVDLSGSMQGKDIVGVYTELDEHLSELPGSKTLSGTFSDEIVFYQPEQLLKKLQGASFLSGGTQFVSALQKLHAQLIKEAPDTANINFYVITDAGFGAEDWARLRELEHLHKFYNITFVAQDEWLDEDSRHNLEKFKRFKLLLLQ